MERLSYECAFHPRTSLLPRALTSSDAQANKTLRALENVPRCVMQRKLSRLVSGREKNVLWVDFSPDPDPPAPRFPGANGLREIGDEMTSATKDIFDAFPKSPAAKHCLGTKRGSVNTSPPGFFTWRGIHQSLRQPAGQKETSPVGVESEIMRRGRR